MTLRTPSDQKRRKWRIKINKRVTMAPLKLDEMSGGLRVIELPTEKVR